MLYSSVNGQETKIISLSDRGLSYGDGIFTTAKILDGQVELLDLHIQRLQKSCQKLAIASPDFEKIEQELIDVAKRYQLAVIKVVITAGQGGRGYSRLDNSAANVIISVSNFPQHYEQWTKLGIEIGISEHRLGKNPMLSGVKHLNRLEQVLIRAELDHRPEDDLLVINIDDRVIESSCANVFWFVEDQLFTPDIQSSGVAGLMRDVILKSRNDVQVVSVSISALSECSAMFICNSVMGIIPVVQFEHRTLSISPVLTVQDAVQKLLSGIE